MARYRELVNDRTALESIFGGTDKYDDNVADVALKFLEITDSSEFQSKKVKLDKKFRDKIYGILERRCPDMLAEIDNREDVFLDDVYSWLIEYYENNVGVPAGYGYIP